MRFGAKDTLLCKAEDFERRTKLLSHCGGIVVAVMDTTMKSSFGCYVFNGSMLLQFWKQMK